MMRFNVHEPFLRLAAFLSALLLAPASITGAQPIAVDHCGQSFTGGGFLVGNLNCLADLTAPPAVTIVNSGTLELRGFSINGGLYGILCTGSCVVFGGGSVSGAVKDGINAAGSLMVQNVTSSGNGFGGLLAGRSARVIDSTLEGNQRAGVHSYGALRVSGTTSTGNGSGADAEGSARLSQVTISGNEYAGVFAGGIRLVDSSVTGNTNDPDCGVDFACADLVAIERRPSLRNSTCGTSVKSQTLPAETWGVCSAD
jgi:hypothetical protein